jgi:hypothetical protein
MDCYIIQPCSTLCDFFSQLFQGKAGRVTSQAVSCRPVTVAVSAQSQVSPCDSCDEQNGAGTSSILSMRHIHSFAYHWRCSVSVNDSVVEWHTNTLYSTKNCSHNSFLLHYSFVLSQRPLEYYHSPLSPRTRSQTIHHSRHNIPPPHYKSEWQAA